MCWFVLNGSLVSRSRCSLRDVICLLRIYVLSSLCGLVNIYWGHHMVDGARQRPEVVAES
jgi:hypothetical protein